MIKAFHVFVRVVAVISCFNIAAWGYNHYLCEGVKHAIVNHRFRPEKTHLEIGGIENRYLKIIHEYVSNRDLYAETLVKPIRSSIPTNRGKRKMYHRPSVYRR